MPPKQGRPDPPRPPKGQVARRRAVAALLLVGFLGLALWLGVSAFGDSDTEEPPAATTLAAPKPKLLHVVFPEGFTRKEMVTRVAEVRQIAKTKRKVTPTLSRQHVCEGVEGGVGAAVVQEERERPIEGFLFPATYEFTPKTTGAQLVDEQIEHFERNWAKVDSPTAKKKNLTPYDVLIIASMVEKETIAPDERPKVAAVIYNRLKARMPLGIDATIRYGLDIPGTEGAPRLPARERQPVQHPQPHRTAADADREPRAGIDAGRRAPGEGRLPLLRAQAGQDPSLLHGQREGVLRQGLRDGFGCG